MQRLVTEKHLSRSFLTSVLFFVSLFLSSLSPFTVSLDHALQNSLHDLREREKKEEKWVRATYFFPTVHGGRGWRCYRQLDESRA